MSRYRGPRLKIARRLKQELPGFTKKTSNKEFKLVQSVGKKTKLSQYAIRLQEKQKLRFNYGLTESQLINYVKLARKMKGATGEILVQLLEMRLDNIIFQLGITSTIVSARQLVNHGHIIVNNQKITIPSYQCKINDIISFSKRKTSQKILSNGFENLNSHIIPSHLSFDQNLLNGKVNNLANRQSVNLNLNELLIVEYYSRRV